MPRIPFGICLKYMVTIYKKHIEAVERVQRRATKIKQLPGMKDLPYPERLKLLKIANPCV